MKIKYKFHKKDLINLGQTKRINIRNSNIIGDRRPAVDERRIKIFFAVFAVCDFDDDAVSKHPPSLIPPSYSTRYIIY